MDKAAILKALIIAIMIYYLVKGILYLLMWQVLSKIEERNKERAAKAKAIIMEKRRLRDEEEAKLREEQKKRKYY